MVGRLPHDATAVAECPSPARLYISQSVDRRGNMAARSAHQRSSTSTAERARDTQQQITVLLARSALLRQWSR